MGRPRKKRLVEDQPPESLPDVPLDMPNSEDKAEQTGLGLPLEFSTDSQLEYLGNPAQHGDMDFLDLLQPPQHDTFNVGNTSDAHMYDPGNGFHFGDLGFPMTYNGGLDAPTDGPLTTSNFQYDASSKHLVHSLGQYMQAQPPLPSDPADSTSSELSGSSPEPLASHSLSTSMAASCGCLSSLYLAMDSLTHLPNNVMAAIRVVRNATKAAHNVLDCYVCCKVEISEDMRPLPIQSLQNYMCLGALVPTACTAYGQILDMVDAEVASARKEGRMMWFSMADVGNSNGFQPTCMLLAPYDNKNLDAATWRRLLRGLIVLDVHGPRREHTMEESQMGSHEGQGLSGVVRTLVARSRYRHDAMDDLVAQGKPVQGLKFCGGSKPYMPLPEEQRPCVRNLETARMALENFVID
jgi:hypothetical protein